MEHNDMIAEAFSLQDNYYTSTMQRGQSKHVCIRRAEGEMGSGAKKVVKRDMLDHKNKTDALLSFPTGVLKAKAGNLTAKLCIITVWNTITEGE